LMYTSDGVGDERGKARCNEIQDDDPDWNPDLTIQQPLYQV
jgi:hypothetical protein